MTATVAVINLRTTSASSLSASVLTPVPINIGIERAVP